jgi:outer membrane protein assembly factor BamB
VDLGLPGGSLIADVDYNSVWEAGPGGRVRRELTDLAGPYDVQALGGGRLLIAEYLGRRVTERDRKGTVLWQKPIADPISCRRLASGNTFIATPRRIVEVTPAGTEVFSFPLREDQRPAYGACRPAGSPIVYLACPTELLAVDTSQRPMVAKSVGLQGEISDVQEAAGGHLLVTQGRDNAARVVEIDSAGKLFRELRLKRATSATRLANGNILVAATSDRRLVLFDDTGKIIWKKTDPNSRPMRVRKR